MIEKLLFVAAGGAIGAVMRFLCVGWIGRMSGDTALGTLFVNVAGSFLLGCAAVLAMERYPEELSRTVPFVVTGVLGAFTTFSAFSLDAVRLYEDGRTIAAAAYVGGSVALSLVGMIAGIALLRWSLA